MSEKGYAGNVTHISTRLKLLLEDTIKLKELDIGVVNFDDFGRLRRIQTTVIVYGNVFWYPFSERRKNSNLKELKLICLRFVQV